MDTLKISISKANSIRFAHRNGLMNSFDNLLWCEESWQSKKSGKYNQIFFKDDEVLVQLKAGLTATVVLTKYIDNVPTIIASTLVTTYSTFKIYEYVLTLSSLETFYLTATSEQSTWISQNIEVVDTDSDYLLLQWTNLDDQNNTFEFDYTTATAIANVNFNRIKGETLVYKPAGESTIYDNQNEKSKIKSNYFRSLTISTEKIPRQLAEKLIIAMQHDSFLVNQVGYIVEDLPEIEMAGGFTQLSADMTLQDSIGLNTHDIGFDCDSTSNAMVENKGQEDATGSGTFSVTEGYGVTQIVAKFKSGTPILKVGSSAGGEEIFTAEEITLAIPPHVENVRYTASGSAAWTIYWDVSGGVIDLWIQTIQFNPQP